MDRHDDIEATQSELAQLHELDVAVQAKHGVRYLSYWFDPEAHAVFCLVDAPNSQAAEAVHAEAHGAMPSKIIEVEGQVVSGFLGPLPKPSDSDANAGSAFRAILFTDIVDSTKITQQLGDLLAMEVVHAHNRIVRGALLETRGVEVKHTGDGIMASFASVEPSIECAVAIQRRLEDHRRDAEHPEVRIGISAGEPVTEHNDLFGSAVQLAARACAQADVSGILVSTAVRERCEGTPIDFVERGPYELKGFETPIPLFEVSWQTAS
jgi:class 3 adenylate cyclase